MKSLFRLLALAFVLVLLIFGAFHESHRVRSFSTGETRVRSGRDFVAAATNDGLVRREGVLYDAYSVVPGMAEAKDCKT